MTVSGAEIYFARKEGVGSALPHGMPAFDGVLQVLHVGDALGSSDDIVRAVAMPKATAPSTPPTGYVWWDTTATVLKLYDSAAWRCLVEGPGSSTDNRVVRFDGAAGKIQGTGVTIDDADHVAGAASLTLPNSGLHLLDTDASHDLVVAPGSDLTADRTLTVTTGDASRTLTLSGDLTVSAAATVGGTNTGDQVKHKVFVVQSTGRLTLTNQAAAAQFLNNVTQAIYKTDLDTYTHVRLTALITTVGAAGSKLRVGYATSISTPVVIGDFSAHVGASEVSCSMAAVGMIDSGWIALAAGAKIASCFWTIEQSGGDAVADPVISGIVVEFKGSA